MTSSPAPDLEELERLFDSAVGADFLPVGWQAVFGYVPALVTELRAARAAVAESGRLTALDLAIAMNTAQIQCAEIRLGHDLLVPATRILRALLATPPAPSDHGACTNCHHAYAEHTGRSLRPYTMPRLPSGLGPPELRPGWCCEHLEDALHTCPCPEFFAATPPAPSDHGAAEDAVCACGHAVHDDFCRQWVPPKVRGCPCERRGLPALLAAPSVPPEETRP